MKYSSGRLSVSIKLLLLEDDLLFGESIQDVLEEEGYDVTLCRNGNEALETTFLQKFDAYLLDVNVPLLDGLSLLASLRGADDQTPTMFLTSHSDMETLSCAYANGADDYLKKPFDTQELIMRLGVLLRKGKPKGQLHSLGSLVLDEVHKRILLDESEITLSPKEYQLMALLMRNCGVVVTKEMMIDEMWSTSEMMSEGSIRVYINRLKNLIGSAQIHNVRGFGYRLVP
ncbi:MAG: response regulator transcription factor [Sulfuricurvum sp.]|nr:response regulator transcription factor [Sulfuricurvum sp.]